MINKIERGKGISRLMPIPDYNKQLSLISFLKDDNVIYFCPQCKRREELIKQKVLVLCGCGTEMSRVK